MQFNIGDLVQFNFGTNLALVVDTTENYLQIQWQHPPRLEWRYREHLKLVSRAV